MVEDHRLGGVPPAILRTEMPHDECIVSEGHLACSARSDGLQSVGNTVSVSSPRRQASHLQTGTSVPCLYVGFAIPDQGFNLASKCTSQKLI